MTDPTSVLACIHELPLGACTICIRPLPGEDTRVEPLARALVHWGAAGGWEDPENRRARHEAMAESFALLGVIDRYDKLRAALSDYTRADELIVVIAASVLTATDDGLDNVAGWKFVARVVIEHIRGWAR